VCPLFESALLALLAFASTNIDDALLLMGFFAGRRQTARAVILGQYLGMAILVGAALLLSLLALAVPRHYVGFIGVLPILIGAKHLWNGLRQKRGGGAAGPSAVEAGRFGAIITVALVTIANGGDNIAVYTPLFAARPALDGVLICAIFAVMTGFWCVAARWLVRRHEGGARFRLWGDRAMPFVLIALGIYILLRTGAIPP
jgi:cadmium resistance protein CadD (predicted permease)